MPNRPPAILAAAASVEHSLDALLAGLKQLAALPLSAATAMSPEMYTSEPILALERQRIFRRSWLCVGRAESIPQYGDYLTCQVDTQPVVVIRQHNGAIKAFANVCRHRMMRLLEGRGQRRRIVCPYHAWSYHCDGRLIAAPQMQSRAGFERSDYSLAPVCCEIWQGWVYVTLNPDAVPVRTQLAELSTVVAPYRMADYRQVAVEDHVWHTNWKQLTENFMEGYHLPVVHKATVGGYFPVEETRFSDQPANPAFTYQSFIKDRQAPVGIAHKHNRRLKGVQRQTSVLPTIFPSHMITLAPDHLWYLALQPLAVDRVHIRYGIALAPEVLRTTADAEQLTAEIKAFLDTVNQEDRHVVEGIHQGARAPLSTPGPLCWLEKENHEFTQYISRMLTAELA